MSTKLILPSVRLSYAHVFKKGVYEDGEASKYECSMLFPKEDTVLHDKVKAIALAAIVEKYGSLEKAPKAFQAIMANFGSSDKCSFKDGDMKDGDENEGMWIFKGSNAARPAVYDQSRNPTTEDDGLIYSGAYADVQVSFWCQDNSYGKKLNGNLHGIRFRKHGDPLAGGAASSKADDFEEIGAEATEEDFEF